MNRSKLVAILAVLGIVAAVAMSSIYTVSEVEQAIITQFGRPIGAPVTTAGLKVKVPFIQDVNLIDKRVLEWDGNPTDMPTKDKLYISVDLFARWRIADPLQYFLRLHDERSAQSRLDDILGSETRNAVAKHELIEIIRTTKDRVPLRDTLLTGAGPEQDMGSLVPIQKGRKLVEQEIFSEAAEKVRVFGIELLDIRFKRINYNESVRPKIYDRMISERRQIAERFLSEGNGEAARIRGNRVRDLNKIQSEAYRQVEELAKPVVVAGRSHTGFNPASGADVKLFGAVLDGNHLVRGFRNAEIREALYGSTEDAGQRRRQSHAVGRLLKRLRHCAKITSAMVTMWTNGVVPSWQDRARLESHSCLGCWRHLPASGILVRIQHSSTVEPFGRARSPYVLEHLLVACQRLSGPVAADQAEHAVVDRVPLRGSRRVVRHRDHQAELVGKLLQRHLPLPFPVGVGSARVRLDQQSLDPRVAPSTGHQPPTADARHRERRRLV